MVSAKPLPTFPDGFPEDLLKKFTEVTGRGVLCNLPYSGTEVIKDYGEESVKTGKVKVTGAIYDIASGKVIMMEQKKIDQIFSEVEKDPSRSTEEFAN